MCQPNSGKNHSALLKIWLKDSSTCWNNVWDGSTPNMSIFFPIRELQLNLPQLSTFQRTKNKWPQIFQNKTHGTDQRYGVLGNPDAILVLRKVEAAPNRAQETLKGNETQRKVFFSPLSPLYRAASSCRGRRPLWERWQHLPAELTMRKGVWPQCWVCPSTMAAMSPGQGHWGQPAWNESRVKMAGKWQAVSQLVKHSRECCLWEKGLGGY